MVNILVGKGGHTLFLRGGRRGFDPHQFRRTKCGFFPASFRRWRFEMKLSPFVMNIFARFEQFNNITAPFDLKSIFCLSL
jgi:hypothetical protein